MARRYYRRYKECLLPEEELEGIQPAARFSQTWNLASEGREGASGIELQA